MSTPQQLSILDLDLVRILAFALPIFYNCGVL
ncbi:hypothetical protein SAMN05216525_110135 [Bradyrhizobium sp. Gha]|nr:hypothetical protein SAMN05216525_110135 [Bradyrhizobium sp. Gha]